MIDVGVPTLRFSEFSGAWEGSQLGDAIQSIDSGWSPLCMERQAYSDEWGVLATTSTTWEGYSDRFNKALPAGLEPKFAMEVKAGDILVTRAGPFERVGVIAHVDSTRPKLMLSDKLIRIRSKNENDSRFISRLLGRDRYQRFLAGRKSGLAEAQVNLTQDILQKGPVVSPTLPEQQKIADFLGAVDARVGLLRRRRDALRAYKKGMMQRLFSQELRFTKPDGSPFPDWQEKRLGEIAIRVTEKNTNEAIKFVLTNSAVQGIVSQQDYFDKDIANENNLGGYYVVQKGDFIYNPRISVSAPVGPIKQSGFELGVMSPLYTVFRFTDQNEQFFNQYFAGTLWFKYLKTVANYGARHDRMAIGTGDFMAMPLPYPHPEEQQKIADTLTALDVKINAVTAQMDAMLRFKKGLLQQMFV